MNEEKFELLQKTYLNLLAPYIRGSCFAKEGQSEEEALKEMIDTIFATMLAEGDMDCDEQG